MDSPLVSVIIPVYNSEKYLAVCIESVISQSWANREVIIVDDGSTDESLKIAHNYESDQIRVISQKNQGASVARNAGLKEAKGDYIQFLDADDLLSPDKIEEQLKVLNGSKVHVALCRTLHFFGDDNKLRSPREDWYCADSDDPVDFLTKLYAGTEVMPGYGGMIQPNAWLTPRELINKAGMWNEFRCPDDDGEFFCRVILASEGIKYSSKGLNYYRKFRDSNSLSGQKSLAAFESVVVSFGLKYSYMKARTTDPVIDRIFAKHYWWTGVSAYPKFKNFSEKCTRRAIELGYTGKKYVGGPAGHALAKYFGWKAARRLLYYQQSIKKLWAR